MTAEEKKEAVIRLQKALDAGDRETVAELLHEDFEMRQMEIPDPNDSGNPAPNTMDKAAYLEFGVPSCQRVTRGGMNFTFELAACDGDHVFLLGNSHAIGHNGRPYNNVYNWYFRFSGDKIIHKREYRDTHHSRVVLFE